MQQRLTRSRTEVIFAGVCGGLGEYFGIDPVIIRLIFVLVTLTTGIGLLVYPVLWIAMPKAQASSWSAQPGAPRAINTTEAQSYVMQDAAQREQVASGAARSAAPPRYADAPPPPSAYNFDPITGQPLRQGTPSTGQTTQLPYDPTLAEYQPTQQPQPAPPRKRAPWMAFVLIGFGVLVLSEALGINLDIVFPIIMIVCGFLLLRRK
jgi:phage shock protein C